MPAQSTFDRDGEVVLLSSDDDDGVALVQARAATSRPPKRTVRAAPSPPSAKDILPTIQSPPMPYTGTLAAPGFHVRASRTASTESLPFEKSLIPNCLAGLTFVLTGEMPNYDRDLLAGLFKRFGGKVTTSISGKTSCLVVGDEPGPSKLQKAADLGTKILDERGVLDLLRRLRKPGSKEEIPESPFADLDADVKPKLETTSIDLTADDLPDSVNPKPPVAPGSAKPPASGTATRSVSRTELWTAKYAPRTLGEICGNRSAVVKLQQWLSGWKRAHSGAGKAASSEFRAAMLSGPPGIGKTTAAHLVAHALKYRVIEYNASDTRSKSLLTSQVAPTLANSAVAQHGTAPILVILDEVDGMSAGDRGGVGAMAALCRTTSVPLILICNERGLPKMKPFDRCVLDIPFRKPDPQSCVTRVLQIAQKEGFSLNERTAEELVSVCGSDLRQVVNLLQHYRTTSADMSTEEARRAATKWLKEQVLGPFDVAQKLFANSDGALTLPQQMELYFNDYDLVPLMVAENYMPATLKAAESASESISIGDLVERKVRRDQQWALMPLHALLSTVVPAQYKARSNTAGTVRPNRYVGLRFTAFLGNLSSGNRRRRELAELDAHMRLCMPLSVQDLRLDVLPVFSKLLWKPLLANDVAGTIALMDEYYVTREDFDVIGDLLVGPKLEIATATKSAFTRKYNSMAHPLPFMRAASAKAAAKQSEITTTPDTDDVVVDDSAGAEVKQLTEEEKLEEAMKNDKYIKMKPKKAAKRQAPKAAKAKTPVKRTKKLT